MFKNVFFAYGYIIIDILNRLVVNTGNRGELATEKEEEGLAGDQLLCEIQSKEIGLAKLSSKDIYPMPDPVAKKSC